MNRSTRFIAGNARHPGTRPGQPGIKGTLKTYYGRASEGHGRAGERYGDKKDITLTQVGLLELVGGTTAENDDLIGSLINAEGEFGK